MRDSRKTKPEGTQVFSQEKARALGTGIGQTANAAMATGTDRSQHVIDGCIDPKQRAASFGYPKAMASDSSEGVACVIQTTLK